MFVKCFVLALGFHNTGVKKGGFNNLSLILKKSNNKKLFEWSV